MTATPGSAELIAGIAQMLEGHTFGFVQGNHHKEVATRIVDEALRRLAANPANKLNELLDKLRATSPSPAVAAEPVAAGTLLARPSRPGEKRTFGPDAAPLVRGDREAIADEAIEEAIKAFARLNGNAIPRLTFDSGPYDITQATLAAKNFAHAILSLPVQPGAGEREADTQAKALCEFIFGPRRHLNQFGFVGIGKDEFHVYVHSELWGGPRIETWEGLPVIWHLNIGPITAIGPSRQAPHSSSETER